MQIKAHGDHLIQLTRFWVMNCFLVREDDGFTLVDTGMSGSAKGILEAARHLGEPIRRIVLTHAHPDHIGSLDALHALLPDAEVAISTRDARLLGGDTSLDAGEPPVPPKAALICTTKPTHLLQPGEVVKSLEVIAAPGHSPGHIVLFDHRDNTLIAGDAFTTQGGISTAGTLRPLFPIMAFTNWYKPLALRSAETLCALPVKRLAVGHGPVLTDPIPAMRRAVADAKRHVREEYAFAHQEKH